MSKSSIFSWVFLDLNREWDAPEKIDIRHFSNKLLDSRYTSSLGGTSPRYYNLKFIDENTLYFSSQQKGVVLSNFTLTIKPGKKVYLNATSFRKLTFVFGILFFLAIAIIFGVAIESWLAFLFFILPTFLFYRAIIKFEKTALSQMDAEAGFIKQLIHQTAGG